MNGGIFYVVTKLKVLKFIQCITPAEQEASCRGSFKCARADVRARTAE